MYSALPAIYVVQPGDSLSSISLHFSGSAGNWPELYAANKSVIGSNPNEIYPGQSLRLSFSGKHESGTTLTGTTKYTPRHDSGVPSGTLSCSGLEMLWDDGGGNTAYAITAASIAMAESGGQEYATGAAGERGYWQINPDHGSLSTYDPLGNAKAAVSISADGTNWTPWTTYTSGLYYGRC